MKIITAFDSFKGCMTAIEACHASSLGLLEQYPDSNIQSIPLSDGGEGMVECIVKATDADVVTLMLHGPLMEITEAKYAISQDGQTAYMEMAEASGLSLVPEDKRNPILTTTYGVGEMIMDAVSRGCKHIVIGIGGSATCDAGKGMVEYLSPYLPLPVDIVVASDVNNPLYGENGAAYVFAPQKGATPEQVIELDERLKLFARQTEEAGIATPQLADSPGAGAAGGLGYALMAYLDARLCPGIDLMLDAVGFDEHIKDADIVLTGEGKSDRQTLMGKVPYGVLQRALRHNVPVTLLSGAIEDINLLADAGFVSIHSINEGDTRPLHELMQKEVAIDNMKKMVSSVIRL